MKTDYSEKEFEMIKAISTHWATLIEQEHDSSVVPPQVLRILAEECFTFNKTGPAVESLRRCVKALNYEHAYRHTPEYEALIQL